MFAGLRPLVELEWGRTAALLLRRTPCVCRPLYTRLLGDRLLFYGFLAGKTGVGGDNNQRHETLIWNSRPAESDSGWRWLFKPLDGAVDDENLPKARELHKEKKWRRRIDLFWKWNAGFSLLLLFVCAMGNQYFSALPVVAGRVFVCGMKRRWLLLFFCALTNVCSLSGDCPPVRLPLLSALSVSIRGDFYLHMNGHQKGKQRPQLSR